VDAGFTVGERRLRSRRDDEQRAERRQRRDHATFAAAVRARHAIVDGGGLIDTDGPRSQMTCEGRSSTKGSCSATG
jgi:hypothetical protein